MINVNQITSQLARLPDPALQKYAQMHKNDPYIMALTMSEFNRRKQTRQGAQMNAPEQPKVVDQAIQSMGASMPEDVGIAQLPAGDMNFAEGGIVAFSDGGDVPRYQSRGLVRPGPGLYETDPRLTREAVERAKIYRDFFRLGRSPVGTAASVAGPAAALSLVPAGMAYGLTSAMDEMRAQGYPVDPMGEFGTGAATPAQASFDEDRRQRLLRTQAQKRAEDARLNAAVEGRPAPAAPAAVAPGANPPVAPAAGPAAVPGAAPGAGAGPGTNRGQRPPSGGPGAAAPSAAQDPLIAQLLRPVSATPNNFEPSQSTMPTVEQIKALYASNEPKPEDATDYFKAQRKAITDTALRQNLEYQAEHARQVKERGLLGEKQEARLKTREEKLGKQEKDLGPLAMIQAGFAIMGGQSRSALQNIGLGAQVGFKGYREGVDKLQASRERIEDGLERIETARRSEGILNDQQSNALRREGNAIILEGERAGVAALMDDFNYKRGRAVAQIKSSVDLLIKKGEIGSGERLGAAQIQSAADRSAQQIGAENVRAAVQAQTSTQNARTQAAATAASAKDSRMASLAEQVRKNVVAEALKKYPYDVSAQNAYAIDEIKRAVQANPGLAQYMGVSGGGGAPVAGAATHRLNPATGQIEPVR